MYFSQEQIAQSLERLGKLNSFFGTVFLAFKQARLDIGKPHPLNFRKTVNSFLQKYFLYYPFAENQRAYVSNRSPKNRRIYTPFSTSNTTRWNKEPFVNSLGYVSGNFTDTFVYPPSKARREGWAWDIHYVRKLKEGLVGNGLIPTFDLAVWLFRTRQWPDNIQAEGIIHTFLEEFLILNEEHVLFDLQPPLLANPWLQAEPITYQSLLGIVGTPSDGVAEGGAALKQLRLIEVGPAKKLEYRFTPRLNLVTGDNGLGKTFLLECAWWALTGTWARADYPAYPRLDAPKNAPRIDFQIGKDVEPDKIQAVKYNWDRQEWVAPAKRDVLPGLSIFAQADGSFVIWDPAKHLLLESKRGSEVNGAALIRLSRTQVWEGLQEGPDGRRVFLCEGLVRDWSTWQTLERARFEDFCAALEALSPEELLIPGEMTKLPPDARTMPTLKFPYGEVPIVLCSAGIQRVLTLAYMLVWAWHEHLSTSKSLRRMPEQSIVLLIDEMEAHLHPFWQRLIAPALLNVVQRLSPEAQTQLIIATHSPLVLASVEDRFDRHKDSLFHLYLQNGEIKLDAVEFVKRGRVDLWLMSDLFGLKHPRSKIAEEVIEEAKLLQQVKKPSPNKIQEVSQKLTTVLAQDDEFWPRWTYFARQQGVVL